MYDILLYLVLSVNKSILLSLIKFARILMTSINNILYGVFDLNRTAGFIMALNKNVGVAVYCIKL